MLNLSAPVLIKALLLLSFAVSSPANASEFKTEEVEFVSQKAKLSGTIVFPEKVQLRAALVFVHGSGKQLRNLQLAESLASHGIATLVYDKRGVGQSGGAYESEQSVSGHNISLLADDAVAALGLLRRHPKTENVAVGLSGISQAGWIVPLAAERARSADFLVLWSGPVSRVSEEDIYSKHTNDRDSDNPPTFAEALAARTQRYTWPSFLGKDTDPTESLSRLKVPGLWIFGARDGSIPVELSIQNLKKLAELNKDYAYVLFSNQGHNNMSETLSTAVDWMRRVNRPMR
ncbi:MAG: alpha/beta hydrolase [Verrucomicrobia bacterium]|nr:alpha/beta hydrolase [Verrucomicrobiota bacterium]